MLEIEKPDSRTAYPVMTRDWALRLSRRSSPPLCDLFPEYYGPIEPDQTSSSLELANKPKISRFDDALPQTDKMSTESLHSTGNEPQVRELQSLRRAVFPSDGLDKAINAMPPSDTPSITQQPLSDRSEAPAPIPASRHHCLVSGHVFEHYRLSRLPSEVEIDGLGPASQRSTHKQEDLKVSCMVCRARIREHFWKCTIPVCLREVCDGCRSRLDQDRANGAKAGWREGT